MDRGEDGRQGSCSGQNENILYCIGTKGDKERRGGGEGTSRAIRAQ